MISSPTRRPSASPASTAPSSVTSRAPDHARLDGRRELAAVARLLPVVAEDARRARSRRPRSPPCRARPRPSGSRAGPVAASPRASRISRPGVTVTTTSARERRVPRLGATRAPSSAADGRARARRRRPRRRPSRPSAAKQRAAARPFTPAPIDGARRAWPPERLRGEHRRRAGPQRRHRPGVEQRLDHPRLGIGQDDEPGHGRQPARRIAREGRHPLEQRVTAAERRHRAEVARRVFAT